MCNLTFRNFYKNKEISQGLQVCQPDNIKTLPSDSSVGSVLDCWYLLISKKATDR